MVEPVGDDVKGSLVVDAQVVVVPEVLTQEPVGVLVAAPLPGTRVVFLLFADSSVAGHR